MAPDNHTRPNIDLCQQAAFIILSPQGGLVAGWKDSNADDSSLRNVLEPIAHLISAFIGRWQRERLQRGNRSSISSSGHLSVNVSSQISSAMMAAVKVDSTIESATVDHAQTIDQNTLWRSFALFEIINRGTEDMITIHDSKGACLYVNDACMSILDLDPDALIGKSPYDLTHPDDHGFLRKGLEMMIDHGVSNPIECRVRDAGGHWHWMEARNGAVRDDKGAFTEIVMMFRDIGERRDFEQTLNFSEYNLRAILQNIPDAAWLKDAAGNFLAVNRAGERLFGAENDEMIGRSESEFIGIADAHRSGEYDQMVLLSGEGVSYTHHMGRDDIADAMLEIRKEPLFDDDDQIIGICGYAHDASPQMKLHLDLIRASSLLTMCSNTDHIGLWSISALGHEFYGNKNLMARCGFRADASPPALDTFLQMIDQSQRAALANAIDEAFELRRSFRFAVTIHSCNNSLVDAIISGTSFQNGYGKVSELAGVLLFPKGCEE